MKRILSLVLALLMLASLSSIAAADQLPTATIVVRMNSHTDDLNENEFIAGLAEQAGLKIVFACVYTDWNTKKSTILASGDLPDAFLGSGVLKDSEVGGNKILFANLSELINETDTPNIWKAFQTDDYYRAVCTGLDGDIYWMTDRQPFRPSTYASFFINKNWLDTLNLEVPETLEELENVLVAFRDGDPNGNGIADELPMYMALTGDEAWSINAFMGAFGCAGSMTNYFALDGETVIYQPLTENFKAFMTWIAHLQAEGLMPAELATADGSQRNARMANEIPIVGVLNAWDNSVIGLDYQDQYITIAPMAGPKGDRGVASNYAASAYEPKPKFVLSASSDYKKEIMSFIDLGFIPENGVQLNYGPIGTVLSETDDGIVMNNPPEGMSWNDWKYKYAVNGGWPLLGDETFEGLFAEIPPCDSVKVGLVEVNEPYQFTNSIPALKFTDEENDELSIVQTDVETFVTKKVVEWFANGGVEEEWDSYITELHNMGVDTYIAIYQAAYDRIK